MEIEKIILTLLQVKGIGKKIAENIIYNSMVEIKNLDDLYILILAEQKKNKKIAEIDFEKLKYYYNKSNKIISIIDKEDIKIINKHDEKYPYRYKNIKNPPLILFAKGNIELLNSQCIVSITGTRNPTISAQDRCKKLVETLVKKDVVITSGLAIGCDTIAHKEAIKNNGFTIAIIPSSMDNIYPKENIGLANEIIKKNGLLLSEYPIIINSKINKGQFLERNRLISGISDGLCVIETKKRGGSMQTFKLGKLQKKIIGVIDFDTENENNQGNKILIENENVIKIKEESSILSFIEKIRYNKKKEKKQSSLF
jgi:DNA processing protein